MSQFKVENVTTSEKEKKNILDKISSLEGKKILIIGDVGLDEYIMGQVRRISPEAPVPVLEVENEDLRLGLAANVAQNAVSLGGKVSLISVVGDDAGADRLKDLFKKANVSWQNMISDAHRPTTRKTRIMAQHHHLVRVDYELKKYLRPETETQVLQQFEKEVDAADAIILQDYAKGMLSAGLVKKIFALAHKHNKKIFTDPHRSNAGEFYQGTDLLKPNYDEAISLSGLKFDELRENPNQVYEVGRALQKKTGATDIVLTRGKEGMTIFSKDQIIEVPTFARRVFDVTGAGDTVIAALSLALASGWSLVDACRLANFAAGVVVGKVGCVPCELSELRSYIQDLHLD